MIFDYILDKFTERNYAKIIDDKCIYYKNNDCDKCKSLCPERAISIEYQINIDKELCSSCGICKAVCPTQAIGLKGIGEENLLQTIKDKKNIVFSCSREDGIGNLKLNCLYSFHTELLAALFVLYGDKKFCFNLSRCETCKYNSHSAIFKESLSKAVSFVKMMNLEAKYEIYFDESKLKELSEEVISRRELFSMLKKGTTNVASQAIDTILSNEDDYLSIRKILIKAIKDKNMNIEDTENTESLFFRGYEINDGCNGCSKCEEICPGKAWKIDNSGESIKIYHSVSRCHNCGLCIENCPEKVIREGIINFKGVEEFNIKKEIPLTTCKSCGKKFVSEDNLDKCVVCVKKDNLRKILSSY